jgi:hypothetical protein
MITINKKAKHTRSTMTTEHYGAAFREMEKAERIASALIQAAIEAGAQPRGLNVSNALEKVLRDLRDYRSLLSQAEELGSTLPNIIKSYRMSKRSAEVVPAAFRLAPEHWIIDNRLERQEGWANGKRVEKLYKGRGVSPLVAQGRCKRLQPVIAALLEQYRDSGREGYEEYVSALEQAYQTIPYEEFVAEVFSELRDLHQETGLPEEAGAPGEEVITPFPLA